MSTDTLQPGRKSELERDQEWARFMSREAVKEAAKAQQRFDAELRKWALQFLVSLNAGKPFDGDIFVDADAVVAYVTNGRPVMVQQPAATMAGIDPFNVNTGLAQ